MPVSGPGWPAGATYALWSTRALGYIIDSLFVFGAMIALYLVGAVFFGSVAGLGHAGTHLGGAGCCCLLTLFPLATLLVGLYNKVYLISQRGYSIGQGVMNVKVVDAQGALLTQGNALIRVLVHAGLGFLPFMGLIDLLWPLWDDQRQTLHDKAVGCFVINNPGV